MSGFGVPGVNVAVGEKVGAMVRIIALVSPAVAEVSVPVGGLAVVVTIWTGVVATDVTMPVIGGVVSSTGAATGAVTSDQTDDDRRNRRFALPVRSILSSSPARLALGHSIG